MCPHTYYCICVLRTMAFFCFFVGSSSLNISDRGCASLTLAGIERDTDVCLRVCVCEYVRVCVCVDVYSLSVCVSQAFFSASSIFFSAVRSIYLSSSCYISSSYLSSQRVLIPLHMRRETTLLSTCFTVMILCI